MTIGRFSFAIGKRDVPQTSFFYVTFVQYYIHQHHKHRVSPMQEALEMAHHKRVVFVGDIHGDLMALVAVMEHANLIKRLTDGVRRDARACYTGDGHARTHPLTQKDIDSVVWSGGSAAVIFLGDVLDNRRSAHHDKTGVCGLAGTQQAILHIIVKLAKEAKGCGGRVVWILGNHCCANASRDASSFCVNYAPRYFVSTDGTRRNVCTSGPGKRAFSREWRDVVTNAMDLVDAQAVLLLLFKGRPWGVAVHGFIHPRLGKAVGLRQANSVADACTNARVLNRMYRVMIRGGEGAVSALSRSEPEVLPTWCRASSGQRCDGAKQFFGTSCIVKAHDVHTSVHCAKGVCYTDIGMARAFHFADRRLHAGERHHSRLGYLVAESGNPRAVHFECSFDVR